VISKNQFFRKLIRPLFVPLQTIQLLSDGKRFFRNFYILFYLLRLELLQKSLSEIMNG